MAGLPDLEKMRQMIANAKKDLQERVATQPALPKFISSVQAPVVPQAPTAATPNSDATKANKIADLQARIASRFQSMAAERPAAKQALIFDSDGRPIDARTGQVVALPQHVPTLKANMRMKRQVRFTNELKQTESSKQKGQLAGELADSAFFDPRLSAGRLERKRRAFKFVEPGTFVQKAAKQRAQAQLSALQRSIEENARRTGLASVAKLGTLQSRAGFADRPPAIEWWDAPLIRLPSADGDSKPDSAIGEKTYVDLARLVNQNFSDDWSHLVNADAITALIEHPIELDPPEAEVKRDGKSSEQVVEPKTYLTKEERRKLRRQRRALAAQEEREKVQAGLVPPPQPRVRLANLMRVLGNEAVAEPTKLEKFVRAQADRRQADHAARNASRKLSKAARSAKKARKLKGTGADGSILRALVFRARALANPSIKFKIETNLTQLGLNGLIALHADCNVIVAEGAPPALRRFHRLVLHRLAPHWPLAHKDRPRPNRQAPTSSDGDVKMSDVDAPAAASTIGDSVIDETGRVLCELVWQGEVHEMAFSKLEVKTFTSEQQARDFFKQRQVEHFWDLAYSRTVLDSAAPRAPCI